MTVNLAAFATACRTALTEKGVAVDEVVFKKAMNKTKRHMRAKFGGFNYEMEMQEAGADNFVCFYEETVATPDGVDTFNNNMARQRRSW